MSSELAIGVRNVSKVYRVYERPEHRLIQMATLGRRRPFTEFAALHDVSIDIRRGETIGIVGRNGCGKSTLLQIICGTLQPSGGHVEVRGRIAALLELGAGFNGEFTGRENVYMNGSILGFSREQMDERFEDIARFASIGDFIERPVKTYSSGMFVRLAFAVATAVEPDILIVDEALAVGDEAFQRKCFARIEAIKERGGTILFVSHGAQTIVQLCDRAMLLDAGEKLMEGEPKRVVGQYQRLLNLTEEEARAARAEMRSGETVVEAAVQDGGETKRPSEEASSVEMLDLGLVSQSRVDYPNRGAAIRDLSVRTTSGRPVNVVQRGRRYVFRYVVAFDEDVSNVSFGFMIRTVNGLDVSGTGTATQLGRTPLPHAAAGSECQVEFEWDCRLIPGTYFLNAGVGMVSPDGELVIFHRIVDAYAFRVAVEEKLDFSGIVDLSVAVRVTPSGNAAVPLNHSGAAFAQEMVQQPDL